MPRPRFSLRTLLVVVTVVATVTHVSPMVLEKYRMWQIQRQFNTVQLIVRTTEGWNRYAPHARYLDPVQSDLAPANH
jgi:hypothetical protein